jgi:NAD(P)-dependent dehydrogenase (short-subunit alcohol dehydrogenase family)
MVYEGMWRAVNQSRSNLLGEEFAERIRRDLADTPTGRFQDPADLADIVLFVAGSQGLELSGKTIWSEAHVT